MMTDYRYTFAPIVVGERTRCPPLVVAERHPALLDAVAARYPEAGENTRLRLCHAVLHETAHLFMSLVVGVRPYSLGIRRSGHGWIHTHSHDAREILLNLAGAAMEFRITGIGETIDALPVGARRDTADALQWAKEIGHENPDQLCGFLTGDLFHIFDWRDVAALIEDIAVRIVKEARKDTGELSYKKTHKLNVWVDERLTATGLREELAPFCNRVVPACRRPS